MEPSRTTAVFTITRCAWTPGARTRISLPLRGRRGRRSSASQGAFVPHPRAIMFSRRLERPDVRCCYWKGGSWVDSRQTNQTSGRGIVLHFQREGPVVTSRLAAWYLAPSPVPGSRGLHGRTPAPSPPCHTPAPARQRSTPPVWGAQALSSTDKRIRRYPRARVDAEARSWLTTLGSVCRQQVDWLQP